MMVAGTATAVLELSGAIPDSIALRTIVTVCVLLALASLLFRISVYVLAATCDDSRDNGDSA